MNMKQKFPLCAAIPRAILSVILYSWLPLIAIAPGLADPDLDVPDLVKKKQYVIDIPKHLRGVRISIDGPVIVDDAIEKICRKHRIKLSLAERPASEPQQKANLEFSLGNDGMLFGEFLDMIARSEHCDVQFRHDDFLAEHVLWVRGGADVTLTPKKKIFLSE